MFRKIIDNLWMSESNKDRSFYNDPCEKMNRQPTNSSDLCSVGYAPDKKTLEIEFPGGEIVQYFNVPEKIYQGLLRAEFQGKYFGALIKNFYKSCRVF